MNKRAIIKYILIIILSFAVSHIYTLNTYVNNYKVQWKSGQSGITITNFEVSSKENKLSMFNPSFYVDITINGKMEKITECIDYIHRNERLEMIDGKETLVIEFKPWVRPTVNPFKFSIGNTFSKTFKYKVYGYNSGDLVYLFKCGDFEKTIYANRN